MACKNQGSSNKSSKRDRKKGTGRQSTRRTSSDFSSQNNTYLNCPYSEKEECKKLGGKWDPFRKKWYVPEGLDTKVFSKWLT